MQNNEWNDHGKYWEHTAEQGSDSWLNVRIGRVTSSNSGAMANHSKFKTAEETGKIIAGNPEIFDELSIKRMDHGHVYEKSAREWYSNVYLRGKYKVIERGLIVPKSDLTIGGSIDGDVLNSDGIIEIKCPVKMYNPIKKYIDLTKNGWKPPKGYHDHIFYTHYDQMIHNMAVTGKKWCDYIVYSTQDCQVFVHRINYNHDYWSDFLYPTIKSNYKKYVLPYLNKSYPIIPK